MNQEESKIYPNLDSTYTYEFLPVGKVKISLPVYMSFQNKRDFRHPILAGICRQAFELGNEPPLIDSNFLESEIKNIKYPKSFVEKCNHLLKYIYNNGGNDFKEFKFLGSKDYPLAFADNQEEFNKIIKHLEKNFFIEIGNEMGMSGSRIIFDDVTLTNTGIMEVEKELPKIPMIGLVNQEISTGNIEVDKTINHAKQLFFQQPTSLDKMRSACESLSYVLEPLRKDCENIFGKSDTNDFFKIVNEFDIRHNKERTKQIEYPEQLEWIFYSLLNSINTYTKISKNLK